MKNASITEAKNQLRALPDCEPEGRLSRLIRNGIVWPAGAEARRALFTNQPPRPNAGALAVEALLDERRVLEQTSRGRHCEERLARRSNPDLRSAQRPEIASLRSQ
jgi:hypothetical protein